MYEWEYTKLDLNNLPRKAIDIDVLNKAGNEGWEVVTITPNSIAYLKRQAKRPAARTTRVKVAQTVSNGVVAK